MEGPVKERLTGALILMAALVIIVPEMLLRPGPEAAREGVAPAPPADAGPPLRTYSMVLNGDAVKAGQATLTPQAPAPQAPVATGPAAPAPVAAEPEPVQEQATAAPVTVPAPVPAPSAGVASIAADTARPAGRWWIQLGSFSAQANADRLARQLRAAGYSINVSKINASGKELYRVRAGPVQGRVDAQALQARLATAGHKSTLVAP